MIEPGKIYRTLAEEIQRAVIRTRERDAEIAQMYPVHAYDGDTGELLKLRDAISEAIRKRSLPGEMIK